MVFAARWFDGGQIAKLGADAAAFAKGGKNRPTAAEATACEPGAVTAHAWLLGQRAAGDPPAGVGDQRPGCRTRAYMSMPSSIVASTVASRSTRVAPRVCGYLEG